MDDAHGVRWVFALAVALVVVAGAATAAPSEQTIRSLTATTPNPGDNRAPELFPLSDMAVDPGDTVQQAIQASDPDGDALQFSKLVGPAWAGVTTVTATTGTIVVSPPSTVGGVFSLYVRVVDGRGGYDQDDVILVVTGPTHPPAFAGIVQPLEVLEGETRSVAVYASDPDGAETLHFSKVDGPDFMTVRDLGTPPGRETAFAYIVASPPAGQRGDYSGTVAVSDGATTVTHPVAIWVQSRYRGETSLTMAGDAGNPLLDGQSWRATRWIAATLPDSESVLVTLTPDLAVPDIELAPRLKPDEWKDCAIGPRARIRFAAPAGETLRVGAYANARLLADAGHPGIEASVGCASASGITGSFTVRELRRGLNGAVRSAWITFELFADGSPAPLRGELRYRERAVPVMVEAPDHVLSGVGDDVAFVVSAADSALGSVPVEGDLPPGASLVPLEDPVEYRFTWRPGFEHVGTHRIRFRARGASGDTAFTACDLTIRPRHATTAVLDSRQLEFFTSNRGAFACDVRDSMPGFEYRGPGGPLPAGTSAGLWLGALVDGAPRVALGGTASEFVPGPAPEGAPLPFDVRFKNYSVIRGRTETFDWSAWPADQGAPTDGGAPRIVDDHTIWSVFNDASPEAHAHPGGGTLPLGAEIRQTTVASDHDGPAGKHVRLRFEIRNAGPNRWSNAYVSVGMDPRAERSYSIADQTIVEAHHDRVGCDTTRQAGLAYSSRDFGGIASSVGIAMLRGAVQRSGPSDSLVLGMSSFRRLRSGMPSSAAGVYHVMQGLKEDGTALVDPSQQATTYEVSGDPVQGTGWLDEGAPLESRELLVVTTGPFDVAPGESQTVEVAVAVGTGADRLLAIIDLRATLDAASGVTPIANAAPAWITSRHIDGDEGTPIGVRLLAADPDGDRLVYTAPLLPRGATLTQDGRVDWTPDYEQAGSHAARLVATDVFGAWDSATFVFTIRNVNRAPVARSGGPYRAVAGTGVEFDGSGSSDPDGDPWQLTWSFGDSTQGGGLRPLHFYPNPGVYRVLLQTTDGQASGWDTTTVVIFPPVETRVIAEPGMIIRLASPAPYVTLRLDFDGGGLSPSLLEGTTFTLESLGTGSVGSITASEVLVDLASGASATGSTRVTLVFGKEALRALLGRLPPGRTTTSLVLVASTGQGPIFGTSVILTIEAAPKGLAVFLAPNPMRARGTLTFTTSQPGRVRATLFDVRGRVVRRLFEAARTPAGYHDILFDGRDDRGRPLASGPYFYRIEAADGAVSGRLMKLR